MIQDYQVLQRDADDRARVLLEDGTAVELPVGGPYAIGGARGVLVGDVWVLAGQSNMEGYGDLVDVEPPSPYVHSFQSCERWAAAEEPLHWLAESPRPVHHALLGRAMPPAGQAPGPRDPARIKGAGLGLAFANERYAQTGVPVGLIPCAHGGTSMRQWDPGPRGRGGASLYGATIERIRAVGGRIAGVLWYQGESDAVDGEITAYARRLTALARAFRADCGREDLPFLYVQLGRFVAEPDPASVHHWNAIREAQRQWAGTLPHTALATAIDLELDDAIHLGTAGLRRLGRRLADIAAGARTPDVLGVRQEGDGWRLRILFSRPRGGLVAAGRPAGFTLRDRRGTALPLIHKITLAGDAALLHLTTDALPRGTALWYGWGLDPYCNVTDTGGAAIPAFGPLAMR